MTSDQLTPMNARTRLDSLTSLRFFAALAVFTVHAEGFTGGKLFSAFSVISGAGSTGVSFFFVLSGFVLTWAMKPGEAKRSIYRRRAARIYPAYVVALCAGLALTLLQGAELDILQVVAPFSLTQAWFPDFEVIFALNGPSWTLSCEAFFYLTFPLYSAQLLRISRRTRWVLLALATAAVFTIAAVTTVHRGSTPDLIWFAVHFPPTRTLEFAIGALVAAQILDGGMPDVGVARAVVAVVITYGVASLTSDSDSAVNHALTLIPFVLLIAAFTYSDLAGRPGLLRRRGLVFLGEVSFSFYLVHELVLRVMARFGANRSGMVGVVLVALGLFLSLVAAVALHRVVERPCERRFRTSRPCALPALPGP